MSFELVVMSIMLCGITVAQESNETSVEHVYLSASLAPLMELREEIAAAFGGLFVQGKDLAEYEARYRGVGFNAFINQSEEVYQTGMTIVFPNVLLNEDNSYDATSGKFTAPESSVSYMFTAHACNKLPKTASFAIIKNGEKVAQSIAIVKNQHICASAGALVSLWKGEMVWVNSQTDDWFINSSEHSLPSFYGVLLNLEYFG